MTNSNITFPMRPMKVCPTDCGISLFIFPVVGAVCYVFLVLLWYGEVRGSGTGTIGLIFLLLLFLLGLFLVWFFKWVTGPLRTRRAIARALTNQVLRPQMLRLDERSYNSWQVRWLTPTGAEKSCNWLTAGMPIFMDPSDNIVLGVTTGDGTMCMPLDATLKWIDLTHAERTQMREQIGLERLGGIPLPGDLEPDV